MTKRLLLVITLSLIGIQQASAAPFFIVTAPFSHRSSDDPIVFPGQRGAAHSHDFVCATSTNFNSTTASLEAGGTNCGVRSDHTGYWSPTVLLANGQPAQLVHALFYYARSNAGIPHGLKVITDRHEWGCWPSSTNQGPNPPFSCSEGKLVAIVTFPTWWDGRLDSPDHRSHMSFSRTSTHTRQITQVKGYWRYRVNTGQINITLSSGPHTTYHSDFLEGWVGNSLAQLIARCGGGCGKDPA